MTHRRCFHRIQRRRGQIALALVNDLSTALAASLRQMEKNPAWSRAELSEVRVGVMGQLHLPRRLASILPSHSVCVSAAPIRGYPGDCGDPHLDWEVFAGVPKILVVSIVGVTKQHNAR